MKKISHNFQIMCKNTLLEYNGERYETKDKQDDDYIVVPMGFNYISSNEDSLNYGYREGEYQTIRHAVCHHLMPLFEVSGDDDVDVNKEESLRRLDFALAVFGYSFSPKREGNIFLVVGKTGVGKSLLFRSILGNLHNQSSECSTFKYTIYKDMRDESKSTIAMIRDTDSKLVMLDDDFRAGNILPDEILKKLSTNYSYPKKVLYENNTMLTSTVLPIILTNGLPDIQSQEVRNRIIPIVMTNVLDSMDTMEEYIEFFEDERNLEVLFNMCIEAFERVFLSNGCTFEGKIPQDWASKRDEIKVEKSKR